MKRRIILASLVVLALAAAGTAYGVVARTTAASQTIAVCANDEGQLRLASPNGACRRNEQLLTWNTVGPQGPAGLQGVAGPQGLAGRDGRDGRDATGSSSNPDGVSASLTVTGQKSGQIANGIGVLAVSHEIVSPRDAASGLPTGKRQHKPITVTVQWGASTPKLINALVNNEDLTTVEIDLPAVGSDASSITLRDASVSDFQQHGSTATFSFTYRSITWQVGTTVTQDDWEAPVS